MKRKGKEEHSSIESKTLSISSEEKVVSINTEIFVSDYFMGILHFKNSKSNGSIV